MSNDKLNRDGVKALWDRVFDLIGIITGDVDVKNKGTLQEQVNGVSTRVEECFTSVSNGKKAVANAITGKGISTAEDAEFATMAENIGKIKSTPKLQSKSAALNTGTTSVTMKPDTGYDGLSQATASIVLQEKAATLKTSAQNITPDSGKLLSKVSVPAVPGNAALTNVLAGKTFSSETAGVGKTGTMANKAGTTVKASAVSQDDNNTYLTIPAAGYYDTTSKVYTENSNLGNLVYKLNVQLRSITTSEPAGEWSSNQRYGYKADISKVYPLYKKLSEDNFIIELLGGSGSSSVGNGGAQNAGNSTLTKSYDADTGMLTIDGTGHYHSYDGSSGSYNTAICVYLVLSNVKELP